MFTMMIMTVGLAVMGYAGHTCYQSLTKKERL